MRLVTPLLVISLLCGSLLFTGCASSQYQSTHATGSPQSKKSEELNERLKNNLEAQQFSAALDNVEELLSEFPRDSQLVRLKARILRKMEKTQPALDWLTLNIKNYPDKPEYLFIRGKFLLESGYVESAWDDFQFLLNEEEFNYPELYETLAELELKKERSEAALLYLDKALELAPEKNDLWFQKAKIEYRHYKHTKKKSLLKKARTSVEEAIKRGPESGNIQYDKLQIEILASLKEGELIEKELQALLVKYGQNAWATLRLATLAVNKKDKERAKTLLRDLIQEIPENAKAHFQLATILAMEKDWNGAIDSYSQGLKFNPEATWVKVQLAKINLGLNRLEESLNYLQEALKDGTRDLFVYEMLAKAFNQQNDTYSAENVIIAGLKIEGKNKTLLHEYAKLLEKRGRYTEATRAYEEILAVDPENPVVLGKVGNLLRVTGKQEQAREKLELAVKNAPKLSWTRAYLVELYIEMEEWDLAFAELDRMIQYDSQDYWPHLKKSLLFEKQEKYEQALDEIEHAILLKTSALWLYEVKGEVLEKMRNFKEAVASYRMALKEYPTSSLLLTKLAYVQAALDSEQALELINQALDEEDFGFIAIELYYQLTDTADKIWGFEKGGEAAKVHKLIVSKEYDKARGILKKLKEKKSPHAPFLAFFLNSISHKTKGKLSFTEDERAAAFSAWHFYYLGLEALTKSDYKDAKLFFDQAIKLAPENPWIMAKMAYLQEKAEKSELAVIWLERFLEKRPNNVWVMVQLALNYDLAKQHKKSEAVYKKILERKPNEHVALNNLAWLYLTSKNPELQKVDDALELSKKAVKINPTSANLDTLAEAFFQKKEYYKALKAIEQALDQDRKNLDYFKKQKKKILKAILESDKNK